jgi:hypothetical protein
VRYLRLHQMSREMRAKLVSQNNLERFIEMLDEYYMGLFPS